MEARLERRSNVRACGEDPKRQGGVVRLQAKLQRAFAVVAATVVIAATFDHMLSNTAVLFFSLL